MLVPLQGFTVDKASQIALRQQLFEHCQQQILAGQWQASARLPSVRQLAAHLQVSNFTVAELYDRLQAQNLVFSRPGSGIFIARLNPTLTLAQHNNAETSQLASEVALMRQTLQREPSWLKPAAGWLTEQYLPVQQVRQALKDIAREGQSLTEYGPAQGYLPLRQYLASRLAQLQLVCRASDLLLTHSATHALDLVLRLCLKPGDQVLVDDPGFYNFQAILRLHQLELVFVPRAKDGPDLAALTQLLQQYKAKAYLTNSVLSNPVGTSITPAVAFQVLSLLRQHQVLLIEDDIYADLEPQSAIRYASLADFADNIYIGSLSKTISADLRVGYILASNSRIAALTDLKLMTSTSTPVTVERVVYKVLSSGSYKRHIRQLQQELDRLRQYCLQQFSARGFSAWHEPSGGFALWLQLPNQLCATALAKQMLAHQIVLAPGGHFSQWPDADAFMRVNITECTAAFFKALDLVLAKAAVNTTQHLSP